MTTKINALTRRIREHLDAFEISGDRVACIATAVTTAGRIEIEAERLRNGDKVLRFAGEGASVLVNLENGARVVEGQDKRRPECLRAIDAFIMSLGVGQFLRSDFLDEDGARAVRQITAKQAEDVEAFKEAAELAFFEASFKREPGIDRRELTVIGNKVVLTTRYDGWSRPELTLDASDMKSAAEMLEGAADTMRSQGHAKAARVIRRIVNAQWRVIGRLCEIIDEIN